MSELLIVAASAIGLIVFVSFIAARLIRARKAGFSIRMQIFLALALIVGAFAFGLGILVLDRIKARADLLGEEAALGEAKAVAALIAAEMKSGDASLHDVAQELRAQQAMDSAAQLHLSLVDPAGQTIFKSGRSAAEDGTVSAIADVLVGERMVGRVQVVKPTLEIQQTLADFTPTILVLSLILGAVAAASAMLIGRTIATPIEELTAFAERVSSGDRRAPRPIGFGREVPRLSRAIDSMRRELQGRRFVETFAADLSHELKNPVAAVRASAEVLRDGAATEPEQAEHFLERILEATSRIEALMGDLLSLARLEARGVDQAASHNFGSVAEEAVSSTRELGVEVEVSVDGAVLVQGDKGWLRRAVENLVDNARIHGAGDQPIAVSVTREGDEVHCIVSNSGQVSEHVRQRVFRRFVTTRSDRGGTGLGLAIVRAIADAHGGQVECVDEGPPEVRFRLTLPTL